MHIASCTPPSVRASVLLSDPQARFFYFCFCFCFFCVCGLLFYLSISILCYSAPAGICCKLLPNRCSRSRSSLCLGALAGQCQRQRQPERQCFQCTVQASGRRSPSHPIPPAQWEVHNVFLEFDWTHIRFSSPPVTTNDSGLSPEVVGGSTGRTGLAACPSYVFGSLASGVLFGFERFDFLIPFQVPGSIRLSFGRTIFIFTYGYGNGFSCSLPPL